MEEGPGASSVSSDADQRRYSWDERENLHVSGSE